MNKYMHHMEVQKTGLDPQIYHEKQRKLLCGLHTLNNLFQHKVFTEKMLDAICIALAPPDCWVNPHKSPFGLGNYDINVLMAALQFEGYRLIWFDKRIHPGTINFGRVFGLIMNVQVGKSPLGMQWLKGPDCGHWFAIKNLPSLAEVEFGSINHYYNLDSRLTHPQSIGNGSQYDLVKFLTRELQSTDTHLLLVVTEDVNVSGRWRNFLI